VGVDQGRVFASFRDTKGRDFARLNGQEATVQVVSDQFSNKLRLAELRLFSAASRQTIDGENQVGAHRWTPLEENH